MMKSGTWRNAAETKRKNTIACFFICGQSHYTIQTAASVANLHHHTEHRRIANPHPTARMQRKQTAQAAAQRAHLVARSKRKYVN